MFKINKSTIYFHFNENLLHLFDFTGNIKDLWKRILSTTSQANNGNKDRKKKTKIVSQEGLPITSYTTIFTYLFFVIKKKKN